jgi:uncharacterized protein (DUF1697 family)
MPAVIALLRGVNVGGHGKIAMKELQSLCQSLKLSQVRTNIQSGNVVFMSPHDGLRALPGRLEEALERRFGFRPAVLLRTLDEMRDVVARNPFAGRRDVEPNRLLVLFLVVAPDATEVRSSKADGEEWKLSGRELYIHYPNGMGKSKLTFPSLKVTSTARNWNTVTKLVAMAAALES